MSASILLRQSTWPRLGLSSIADWGSQLFPLFVGTKETFFERQELTGVTTGVSAGLSDGEDGGVMEGI